MTDEKALREKLDAMVKVKSFELFDSEPGFLRKWEFSSTFEAVALDLLARLDAAEAPCVWIPCSEKLPPSGMDVLVYRPDEPNEFAVDFRHYEGDFDQWEMNGVGPVSHWMRLPNPPVQVKQPQDAEGSE